MPSFPAHMSLGTSVHRRASTVSRALVAFSLAPNVGSTKRIQTGLRRTRAAAKRILDMGESLERKIGPQCAHPRAAFRSQAVAGMIEALSATAQRQMGIGSCRHLATEPREIAFAELV